MVATRPVQLVAQTTYRERGEYSKDSDWYSSKGAMMVRVEGMNIDLVSTHLNWGGEFVSSPFWGGLATMLIGGLQSRWNPIDIVLGNTSVFCDPTPEASRLVRQKQLGQLAEFIEHHRDPRNVLMVTGDFNLNANDLADYRVIEAFCRRLGLRDVWAEQYTQAGALLSRGSTDNGGPDEIGRVCSGSPGPHGVPVCDEAATVPDVGRRFDYLLVERPKPDHAQLVDVEVLYRAPFRRPGTHVGCHWDDPEYDDPIYSSDHLGLLTRVHSTARGT